MSITAKTGLFLAAAPVLTAVATSAGAQTVGRYGDPMMGAAHHDYWGMGWMTLLLWALIVIGLVVLIRWVRQMTAEKKSSAPSGQRALEILKERYAKGEIDKAQFDSIKKDLEG